MELQIGSTVGDYQIIEILGAGGMGKVYKVRNTISDRIEAMKVLLPDLSGAPELADRFLREIKVQASLEHPNIAALHTAVRQDNQLLMLMEFVEGVTVEQKLKEGPLPVEKAVDVIRQVLAALEFAHSHGVVHRDIKPANMMLTPSGTVKLMDFGIAKASSDHKLTTTGTTMGSLYYMSPEQIQGAAEVDARSDLYSVGVSLYEIVTGKRPFDGDSQFAIMSAHLQKVPVPPIEIDPRLPQALNDAILMSVQKDPAARFQTAKAFRNALASVIPMPATQTMQEFHIIQPTEPAPRKNRRALWMAIGAAAALAAGIAFVEFAPKKQAKAAAVVSSPAPPAQTASEPAVQTPAPPVATPVATPEPPAAAPPVKEAPVEPTPQPVRPKATHQPVQQAVTKPRPPAPAPPVQQPTQPVQQPAQPVQQPPVVAQRAAQPAANAAELQDLREKLVVMDTRAQGIRGSLGTLQRAQAAEGYNLGSQYTGPAGLMDSYLRGAADALRAGDAAAARRFLEKAEPPIATLERLLNK